MRNIFYYYIKCTLFLFLTLFLGQDFYAQTFTEISTNDKCATPDDRTIVVNFKFEGAAFQLDNNFIIDLSDPSGDFSNSTNITILTDDINNISFDVNAQVSIPRTITGGDGYRIRVTASSDPTKFIESAETYSFYYQPDSGIILNNFEPLFLCNNESAEVEFEVNFFDNLGKTASDYSYIVFKDGFEYDVVEDTSFIISEAGSYRVAINSGDCTSPIIDGSPIFASNIINVDVLDVDIVSILGDNSVEICGQDSYAFQAAVDNESYIYKWYKDGDLIEGLLDYQPVYNSSNDGSQFGVYRLDIEVGNCIESSQEVELRQKNAGFSVSAVSNVTTEDDSTIIILPESNFLLTADVEFDGAEITGLSYRWFDENDFFIGEGETTNVFNSGEYYVQVIDNSSDCPVIVNSEPIVFLDAVSLEPLIVSDDENCSAESTNINLLGINAIATDGNSYPLSAEEMVNFEYQWVKGSEDIIGENATSYSVSSYEENDFYLLNVSIGNGSELISSDSEMLEVLLRPFSSITSSSDSNQLCPGTEINLSIDLLSGFTYAWFKDGEELVVDDASIIAVTEVGSYSVTYEGFGCVNEMEIVEIIEFTDDSLEVSPSTRAVLIEGETMELSAVGADSYEWYNASGELLSMLPEVEVVTLGTYTLIGQIENCSVEKEVVVIADDGSFIVPNIISPFNGDSANDTWKIPNKLSFQPTVNVIVYNSRGQEVLNTNDYQNNWPKDVNDVKSGMLFYYKIIQEDTLIKTGTISVLE